MRSGLWVIYVAMAFSIVAGLFDVVSGIAGDRWSYVFAAVMFLCVTAQLHFLRRILRVRAETRGIVEDTRRLTTLPIPPTNVRVEKPDGTTIPVELVYNGWVNGCHEWIAVAPVTTLDTGGVLKADVLPAHTSITVQNILGH